MEIRLLAAHFGPTNGASGTKIFRLGSLAQDGTQSQLTTLEYMMRHWSLIGYNTSSSNFGWRRASWNDLLGKLMRRWDVCKLGQMMPLRPYSVLKPKAHIAYIGRVA